MVEEVKRQMGRFENLIGFEGKSDVGSKSFIQELIRSLSEKYKKDVHSSIRLHQLEFFYDLIENSRRKQQKALVEEEDDFQPERKRAAAEADEEAPEVEKKVEEKKPDDIVSVDAKDIDDWKDLMTLSKIYYVLEHPKSQGLTWKRRITKKKSITKFTDRDLIEWRVAQHFRLRGLEEWAQSRSDARQMAQESPYDFDGIDEESETKEIEDMFNIFATTKKKKPKITTKKQEKTIKTSRPFKFTDETIEDWTESYSDDSDDMETLEAAEEIIEGPDGEPKDDKFEEQESSFDEEECISEIFSNYQKIEKYRQPIFDEMDQAESLEKWYKLFYEATKDTVDVTETEEMKPPTVTEKKVPEMTEATAKLTGLPAIKESGSEIKDTLPEKMETTIDELPKEEITDVISESTEQPEPETSTGKTIDHQESDTTARTAANVEGKEETTISEDDEHLVSEDVSEENDTKQDSTFDEIEIEEDKDSDGKLTDTPHSDDEN